MKRCVQCAAAFSSEGWTCPRCGFTPGVEGGFLAFAPHILQHVPGYESEFFKTHGGDPADRSFWTYGRAALITWALQRYSPQCARFLEVGCGSGGVLRVLE